MPGNISQTAAILPDDLVEGLKRFMLLAFLGSGLRVRQTPAPFDARNSSLFRKLLQHHAKSEKTLKSSPYGGPTTAAGAYELASRCVAC